MTTDIERNVMILKYLRTQSPLVIQPNERQGTKEHLSGPAVGSSINHERETLCSRLRDSSHRETTIKAALAPGQEKSSAFSGLSVSMEASLDSRVPL